MHTCAYGCLLLSSGAGTSAVISQWLSASAAAVIREAPYMCVHHNPIWGEGVLGFIFPLSPHNKH